VGVVEGRGVEGDMVVEGVALEYQQHKATPTGVLGGRDAEDDRLQRLNTLDVSNLSMEVADGGSLECVNCGGRLPWSHRCRCTRTSSDAKDVGELELEGGCNSSRLLGLDLGDSDAHLEGCEGSGEVDRSAGGSRGGSDRVYHGSLLLLRHSLNGGSALTRGGDHGLDGGDKFMLSVTSIMSMFAMFTVQGMLNCLQLLVFCSMMMAKTAMTIGTTWDDSR
jgi:hypothetical protein